MIPVDGDFVFSFFDTASFNAVMSSADKTPTGPLRCRMDLKVVSFTENIDLYVFDMVSVPNSSLFSYVRVSKS